MFTSLALSTGGLYAAAHIGVVQRVRELGIKIDHFAGCSGGAIVAAMAASGWPIEKMQETFAKQKVNLYDLNWFHPLQGIVKGEKFHAVLKELFPGKVSDYPLTILITSLQKGETVAADPDMPLADALRASAAIPGFFMPLPYKGDEFIDGGIVFKMPLMFLPESDRVIASDIAANTYMTSKHPNILNLFFDTYTIMNAENTRYDVEIAEQQFSKFELIEHHLNEGNFLTSFKLIPQFIQTGYKNAKASLG